MLGVRTYIGLRHTNTILTDWFDLFYCCCNGTDWADKLAGKETIRAHVVCVLPERIRNVEEPETHGYLRAPKAKTVHHIIDRLRTRSLSTCSLSPSHPTMPCLCQVKCQIKCQWCNKYESLCSSLSVFHLLELMVTHSSQGGGGWEHDSSQTFIH